MPPRWETRRLLIMTATEAEKREVAILEGEDWMKVMRLMSC
jgi:hypothetical protein